MKKKINEEESDIKWHDTTGHLMRDKVFVSSEHVEGAEIIGIYLYHRQLQKVKDAILEYNKTTNGLPLAFPLTIKVYPTKYGIISCGSMVINSIDEFPEEDVPCPCGDPNHWLVKIGIIGKE